jgi:cullin-4
MQKQLDDFAAWYNHTYSGRVLSWRHQHTTVTLTARFPNGTKEIGVSLFQAMVLLQFNEADTLDFEEIYARTGIGELWPVDLGSLLELTLTD